MREVSYRKDSIARRGAMLLMLCALLCIACAALASGDEDIALYRDIRLIGGNGKKYHTDPDCPTVGEHTKPLYRFGIEELLAEFSHLHPCPVCVPEHIQAKLPEPQEIVYTIEEMLEMRDRERRWSESWSEGGDSYAWSLEDKAAIYGGSYWTIPTEHDMPKDDAIAIARETVLAQYGASISQEEFAQYTPYLWFYPFVTEDNEIHHCYWVWFGDEQNGYVNAFNVEVVSETGEVRSHEMNEKKKPEPVG